MEHRQTSAITTSGLMMGSSRRKREIRKVYSVFVDGETEKWYLDLLKEYERDRLPRIDIIPEIPKTKKLKDLDELIRSNAEDYEMVFWVVDLDAVQHNDQMDSFLKIVRELKRIENVRVLVNNPCLEFWFLLHMKDTSRVFTRCSKVEKQLRKYPALKNYEKTEKYYKKPNNDIYRKMKPFQRTAFSNANKLGEFSLNEPYQAKAEINQILDLLLEP